MMCIHKKIRIRRESFYFFVILGEIEGNGGEKCDQDDIPANKNCEPESQSENLQQNYPERGPGETEASTGGLCRSGTAMHSSQFCPQKF